MSEKNQQEKVYTNRAKSGNWFYVSDCPCGNLSQNLRNIILRSFPIIRYVLDCPKCKRNTRSYWNRVSAHHEWIEKRIQESKKDGTYKDWSKPNS